jgi:2-polyprenyl-3-methyl-5-hydroxy-6-metoxy-1,4-benzoquinol methylase
MSDNTHATTTPKYHLDGIFNPDASGYVNSHSIQMRLMPSDANVLELGCASGYMSGYMEQILGCRVTGLEWDEDAVAIAQEQASYVYQVDLDAPDALVSARDHAPFDVLYAANILEHLRFPEQVLQNAHALLKDDARIVVVLPNIANWQFRLKLLLGRFDYVDYGVMDRTHTRLYTVKTGRELLEQNGYSVESLHIAGSFIQNQLMLLQQRFKWQNIPLILPNLFGYELIYVARKA